MIATTTGLLSFVVSIVSPLVVYHYLDPQIQAIQHAPRLLCHQSEIRFPNSLSRLTLRVENVGDLPATGAKIVLEFAKGVEFPDIKSIRVTPPAPLTTSVEDRRIIFALNHGLKHGETVQFVAENVRINDRRKLYWTYQDLETPEQGGSVVHAYVFSDHGSGDVQTFYTHR